MSTAKKDEMEKFEKLVKEYNCTKWNSLPKFIKRRVEALKKIQLEQIEIQEQFHKELHELELKYEKKYEPLYEKRAKIISGEVEPTDEECQLPDHLSVSKQNGDQENIEEDLTKEISFSEEEEKNLKPKVKGIPGFWLGCFASTYNFNDSIEPYDKPIMKFLKNIKLSYGNSDDLVTYKLEFQFDENPHFTNKVLTKTYYLKLKADEKDPFGYGGFEAIKSVGCDIDWVQGHDPTKKTITVKQKNKKDGRTREKKKEVERDSFFFFFKPPEATPEGGEEIEEDLGAAIAVDFELGEIIRQSIIPNAPLYYDGYMMDDEDDEDEDDDDDELDSDDMGDSDSDGENSDSDEDESNDSLNASLVKKDSK